jgi:hypothetical protein
VSEEWSGTAWARAHAVPALAAPAMLTFVVVAFRRPDWFREEFRRYV